METLGKFLTFLTWSMLFPVIKHWKTQLVHTLRILHHAENPNQPLVLLFPSCRKGMVCDIWSAHVVLQGWGRGENARTTGHCGCPEPGRGEQETTWRMDQPQIIFQLHPHQAPTSRREPRLLPSPDFGDVHRYRVVLPSRPSSARSSLFARTEWMPRGGGARTTGFHQRYSLSSKDGLLLGNPITHFMPGWTVLPFSETQTNLMRQSFHSRWTLQALPSHHNLALPDLG